MRDEDQGHARLALDVLEEIEILGLDGDLAVSRRLVADDEPWPSRQRDGADDALPHAAAHLVGILAHPPLGGGDPDGAEKVLHALAQRAAAQVLVKERGLRHLSEDGEERVERRHRILQDHGDAPATDAAQLTLALAGQVFSVEDAAASHDAGAPRQEPDDGQERPRLPAPGPPAEAEAFTLVE